MGAIDHVVQTVADKLFISLMKDNRYLLFLNGLKLSVEITLIAAVIGVFLGLLLAIMKMNGKGVFAAFASGYISVFRGTPAVVQLTVIYFVILARSGLPELVIAAVAFGMNSAAYVAEIIRSGIQAVDRGQMEAGRSLGLNFRQTMTTIIIPQAVKNVLPALGNEFITLLKETSVAGYIGIMDLNKAGSKVGALSYDFFVPMFLVAYLYFIMTTTLAGGINRFERSLRRSD